MVPPLAAPPAGTQGTLLSASAPPPPQPPPAPPVRGARGAPVVPPGPPPTSAPEFVAARMVAEARFTEAINLYDALAAAHPEQRVFANFAQILRRKLQWSRARPGQNCTPGGPVPCPNSNSAAPAPSH